MSPLRPENIICPRKCNIAEAKDKDFKITIMNMFKGLVLVSILLLRRDTMTITNLIWKTFNWGLLTVSEV